MSDGGIKSLHEAEYRLAGRSQDDDELDLFFLWTSMRPLGEDFWQETIFEWSFMFHTNLGSYDTIGYGV